MKDHENENIEPVKNGMVPKHKHKEKYPRGSFEDKIWLELDTGKVVQTRLHSPYLRPLRRQTSSEKRQDIKKQFTAELTTRLRRRRSSSFTEHGDYSDIDEEESVGIKKSTSIIRLVGVANWDKLCIDIVTQLLLFVQARDLGALGTCHKAFIEPCTIAARRLARSLCLRAIIEKGPGEPWWRTARAAEMCQNGHYSLVAAGGGHELLINDNGLLYSRGRGPCGQLGLGPQVFECDNPQLILYARHTNNSSRHTNLKIQHVAAGAHHSLAIDTSGNLWYFGKYRQRIFWPCKFDFFLAAEKKKNIIKHCAAGTHHTLCVDYQGRVWALGKNTHGQLGLGGRRLTAELPQPRLISALQGSRAIAVAAGHFHSLVLDDDGALYAFGLGADGRLGLGHCLNAPLPERVLLSCEVHVADLAAGVSHSACTDSLGRLYVWGDVARGALGHRDVEASRSPRLVDLSLGKQNTSFHSLRLMKPRCSLLRTLALDENGHLWSIANFTTKRILLPESKLSSIIPHYRRDNGGAHFRIRHLACSSEDVVLIALASDTHPEQTFYLDLTQLDRHNTPRIKAYTLT